MIQLAALIKLAPFSEETRNGLLASIERMSEDQKFRLTETCWTALSALYQAKLNRVVTSMMGEMAEGKKQHQPSDFQEAEAMLLYEFVSKLDDTGTETGIDEVRKQLERFKKSPTNTQKPAPPST